MSCGTQSIRPFRARLSETDRSRRFRSRLSAAAFFSKSVLSTSEYLFGSSAALYGLFVYRGLFSARHVERGSHHDEEDWHRLGGCFGGPGLVYHHQPRQLCQVGVEENQVRREAPSSDRTGNR